MRVASGKLLLELEAQKGGAYENRNDSHQK